MKKWDNCVPVMDFVEIIQRVSTTYNNGDLICFDVMEIADDIVHITLDKGMFSAISSNSILEEIEDHSSLDFKSDKALKEERKKIGKILEGELTAAVEHETKKELYQKVAEALGCDDTYVKKVLSGERSARTESIVILEEKFGIDAGKIFGKSISGTLNRNALKEMQKIMKRDEEAGDEIRRYINKLKRTFNEMDNDDIKELCERLTDQLDSTIKKDV